MLHVKAEGKACKASLKSPATRWCAGLAGHRMSAVVSSQVPAIAPAATHAFTHGHDRHDYLGEAVNLKHTKA